MTFGIVPIKHATEADIQLLECGPTYWNVWVRRQICILCAGYRFFQYVST